MRSNELKYRGEERLGLLYTVEKNKWRRTKEEGWGDGRGLASRWEYA